LSGNAKGFVTVFEASDGATGNPEDTTWQFFVGKKPVITKNHFLAQAVRLAIETNSQVQVTFEDPNTLSQVRIEFNYGSEITRLAPVPPE
jgi:hypothetical protein